MSWTLITYILNAARRDRVFAGVFILFILCASLSLFFGVAAFVEKSQFTAVFMGYTLRLCGVAGLVLFVVFFIRRSADARDMEFLLTRPISRLSLVLSYGAAFSILALLLGAVSGGVLLLAGGPEVRTAGMLLWTASIMAENMIMANVALFFALSISSAAGAAVAVFALYVLARMMGQILAVVDASSSAPLFQIMENLMQAISAVMPRLDLMGQSALLLYGRAGGEVISAGSASGAGFGFIAAQAVVFSTLALLAAMLDLSRRQF